MESNMAVSTLLQELVVATLVEIGMPVPTDIVQSTLLKDGCFVGHKFRYDGGHAILIAASGVLEFFSADGTLLHRIAIEDGKGRAA
jgi:hypothetical protein